RIAARTADNTTILCRFRASYQNATGAPLLPKMVVTTVRVRAPVFDPQLRPLQATAEYGDVVIAKLFANNTGSGTARQAWSNWTRLYPSTPTRACDLRAPSFTLGMTASAVQLNTTSRFVLTLTIRNAGHAAGIGWLNTTLPSGPAFLSDNGSMPRSNQGRRYS